MTFATLCALVADGCKIGVMLDPLLAPELGVLGAAASVAPTVVEDARPALDALRAALADLEPHIAALPPEKVAALADAAGAMAQWHPSFHMEGRSAVSNPTEG